MKVIGLSGSIAAGKSTAAKMLAKSLRLPVWQADDEVHRLMAKNGAATAAVITAFGGEVKNLAGENGINRRALGRYVFADYARLRKLERIIHPLLAVRRRLFLQRCRRSGCRAVVLDIPLLFENGGNRSCDFTILIRSPRVLFAHRIAARGLEPSLAAKILARQMPDHLKAKLADAVIKNGLGKLHTLKGLKRAVRHALN